MRPPCGTVAGQAAHKRHNERVCIPCADAKSDYVRSLRIRAGASVVHVPVELLRQLLTDVSPEMLAIVQQSLGVRAVAAVRGTTQPSLDEAVTP